MSCWSVLPVAITAVDWPCTSWLERNSGLLPTFDTGSSIQALRWAIVIPPTPARSVILVTTLAVNWPVSYRLERDFCFFPTRRTGNGMSSPGWTIMIPFSGVSSFIIHVVYLFDFTTRISPFLPEKRLRVNRRESSVTVSPLPRKRETFQFEESVI